MPDGLRGEEIPLAARILCLAQTVEVFHAAGGLEAARRVAKRRRGRWFDPGLVDAFLRFCGDRDFWGALESPDVSEWEPPDLALAGDDERLDRIAQAFARGSCSGPACSTTSASSPSRTTSWTSRAS